jgi:hypothetical protein
MTQRTLLFVFALLALTTTTAQAGKVAVTPGLVNGNASDAICCAVNLDQVVLNTTMEIVGFAGVAGVSTAVAISPNGINCISDSTPTVSYCRVLASPKKLRVTFCMTDANGNCLATVTAPTK